MAESKKAMLIIMDGWGIAPPGPGNAVALASTPTYDRFTDGSYPFTTLITSGEAVGLPPGQMGNSEVGHLTIGAGRVLYQELARINKAVETGELAANPTLQKAIAYAKQNQKPFHLIGLLGDGGVHAHSNHLFALLQILKEADVPQIYVWPFLDGRDTDPKSGHGFLADLEEHASATGATVAGLVGRYYAMDRDKRWERVKIAYDLLVHGTGQPVANLSAAVSAAYAAGTTDEFMPAFVHADTPGTPITHIAEGDAVLIFNFRTDRGRELTQALTQHPFLEHNMHPLNVHYVTMTDYDPTYQHVEVMFGQHIPQRVLGEVLANAGLLQIRAAETEKYPHVTFFFNGQNEVPFAGEERIMANSPKVATYDLQPEMSANTLTAMLLPRIATGDATFVAINLANPDMVGHTGIVPAVVKAVETVDAAVAQLVDAGIAAGYQILITADHGNAEYLLNPDGTPNTAHTTNPVPLLLVNGPTGATLSTGSLADLAPTILALLGLPQPVEMTGHNLLGYAK